MVREQPLVTDYYYHVYNRGVAKQEIFLFDRHYRRFERTIDFYLLRHQQLKFSTYLRAKYQPTVLPVQADRLMTAVPQVKLIAYCLMPNHFHFLVQQLTDGGISYFLKELSNSYTRFFNTVTQRIGPLFQGPFKAKLIETNTYLLHLSRYIHLNALEAGLCRKENTVTYPWSSLQQYALNNPAGTLIVDPGIILEQFGNQRKKYLDFCLNYFDYDRSIGSFANLLIDA